MSENFGKIFKKLPRYTVLKKVVIYELYRGKSGMTNLFPVMVYSDFFQESITSYLLTSLVFLARSYRDVQHTHFRMSLKIKVVRQ